MAEFKFKQDAIAPTSDIYYDLFEGKIKPEELLEDEEQIKKVGNAKETLKKFLDEGEKNGNIELI